MAVEMNSNTGTDSVPARAQVVIIGGGVIGCSVACHLTKADRPMPPASGRSWAPHSCFADRVDGTLMDDPRPDDTLEA